jgi:hypothetical protein
MNQPLHHRPWNAESTATRVVPPLLMPVRAKRPIAPVQFSLQTHSREATSIDSQFARQKFTDAPSFASAPNADTPNLLKHPCEFGGAQRLSCSDLAGPSCVHGYSSPLTTASRPHGVTTLCPMLAVPGTRKERGVDNFQDTQV